MSEIFSNIEAMIILYAPTALMFITQFIDWFVSLRRLTKLNVNKQIEPLLIKVNTLVNETKKYKAGVDAIRQENAELLAYIKENQIVTQEVNKSLEECSTGSAAEVKCQDVGCVKVCPCRSLCRIVCRL